MHIQPTLKRFVFILPLLGVLGLLSAADNVPPPRHYMDHIRLDYYLDGAGREQPVKTPAEWAKRRLDILAGMQEATGKLPDRSHLPPLDVKVTGELKGEGFTRLTISFTAESGTDDRIPAFLFLPTTRPAGKRIPAILALHPTSPLGKASVTGEGKVNREYGLELAKRGYVVLCPDYPSFGDYKDYDFAGAAKSGRYTSGTMKGIANHMRCVDLLQSREEVDPDRIGVIGHSLGGHNSIFVAVFDERIKAIVSSCGWTPFGDYYKGKIAGWTSDRYMPSLKDVYKLDAKAVPFDFYELVAALAPRPFFSISPTRDANFDVDGVKKGIAAAKPIYALLGAPEALRVLHPDCAHDFPPDVRAQAYAFFDKALKFDPPVSSIEEKIPDLKNELPRTPPHEPKEALGTFKVLPGFRVELAACEPVVMSPVACDFDENGRLFVCEMLDYPEANPEDPVGRIRILEDTKGDGHYDKSTVFADKIPWPTAVICYDGGVFVGTAPDILYLKDTKGAGKADVRKVVFTGFGRHNVQGLLNCFRWGLDNRIHGATSSCGGKVRRFDQPEGTGLTLNGRDFSFDPKKLDLRPESGGAQHGMCFDDWGRKFATSNSDHLQMVMFEDRYLARNPYLAAASPRVSIATDGPAAEVYRISPVEAWREIRTRLRVSGLVPGMIEGGGRAAGYFSGATGATIYRGDAWPAEYRGQAFIGDVGSNIVHRKLLTPNGVGFVANRVDEGKEFLASSDIWFRPTQFANAPDGSLYVLDCYREVIEHPASLPPMIKKYLDLRSGWDRGRIWRIVPENYQQRPEPRLGEATTAQLVATLEHRNGWHRDTAARLLYERQDPAAIPLLEKLLRESKMPEARMHALYALAGLNRATNPTTQSTNPSFWLDNIVRGLADKDPRVREHAVRIDEMLGEHATGVEQKLSEMASDPDIRVRFQLAFSLGQLRDPSRQSGLFDLMRKDGADKWMRFAILTSLSDGSGYMLRSLAGDFDFRNSPVALDVFSQLALQIGARGREDEIANVIEVIEQYPITNGQPALALMQALAKSGAHVKLMPGGRADALLTELLKAARHTATDPKQGIAARAEAVRTLSLGSFADSRDILVDSLSSKQSTTVQRAGIAALDRFDDPQAAEILVAAWPRLTPRVRQAAADALYSRPPRLLVLLDAADKGKIPLTDLDASRLRVAAESDNTDLRDRARALQVRMKLGRRKDVIDAYRGALTLKGDAAKGKLFFQKTCVACHKLEKVGNDIGPNLVAFQARGAEAFLINILDPNLEVNPQYVDYVVVTRDGRTLTGLLSAETSTSITLKRAQGETDVVLRADIEKMRSTGLSLMAEGLEQQMDQQGMADLIAYLTTVK